MLNFHLGVPGLAPNLFKSLAECDLIRAAKNVHIVESTEYQMLFFDAVNSRAEIALQSDETIRRIAELAEVASTLKTVAVSKPNFFGRSADALRPRKSFPLAEARVGRLSELLGTCETTFHLTIASQVDYILRMHRVSKGDRLMAIRDTQLSWSELVFRIQRSAPERHLVVWDFDHPQAVALPFVDEMLGSAAHDIKQQILSAIQLEAIPNGSGQVDYSDTNFETAAARLDERYDRDLDDIEKMDGVTLVRYEEIPPDLHLW